MVSPPVKQTTAEALYDRIRAHVRAHMTATEGNDTSVGAIAEALGVSCDEVTAAIDLGGYWTCYLPVDGQPKATWPVFEEGE